MTEVIINKGKKKGSISTIGGLKQGQYFEYNKVLFVKTYDSFYSFRLNGLTNFYSCATVITLIDKIEIKTTPEF